MCFRDVAARGRACFLVGAVAIVAAGGLQAQELRRYPAEASQGVCADDDALYAISNRKIVKYDKATGAEVARWVDTQDGRLVHMNAAFVKDGRLYAAHSNYPNLPMASSVEIWDTKDLKPVGRQDFGETDGSLTWVTFYGGHWYAAFVHYAKKGGVPGRGPEFSRVVKYDADWKPLQEWKFPADLNKRFAGYSASGGAFGADGRLYVTGHDAKELYVLKLPDGAEDTLEWVDTVAVPFSGQSFSFDPLDPAVVYGISRKNQEIIAARVRK